LIPGLISSRGNLKTQAEERDRPNDRGFAVKNMDVRPATTRVAQFAQIVMIARNENCGNGDRAKQIGRVAQPDPLGRKIARTDHDIGLSRGIDDGPGGIPVPVKIAES
jgi:hypothetical protein